MNGLMMDSQLTITTIMNHADRINGKSEIVSVTGDNPLHKYTYKDAFRRVRQMANALKKVGFESGDRIATLAWNDYRHFELYYAISCSGQVCHTINPRLFPEQIEFIINHAEDRFIFTDPMFVPLLEQLQHKLPHVEGFVVMTDTAHMPETSLKNAHCYEAFIEGESDSFDWPQLEENSASSMCYTSGTTGYPKGVLHAHRALLGRKPASEFWFNFSDSNDRILHTGKFNWTYVLGSGLMDPLYLGKTVIVHEGKNDAEGWINLIKKHKATIFIGVPTIYRQILQKSTANKNDVKSLRHCMSAGEHLSDEVFDQWHARFALDIYEAVGMSEFSYYISQSAHMPIRPGSAGFPQPGHEIRLLNPDNLEPVKFGEEGMICVPENDPGLFLRYWNLAEETKKYRHDGWFFTGDYARFDKDGYLWFLGRKDDIIKSFGYRVSPYEIERVYKNHQEIIDCAAIGEEIEKNKILVVLYVILKVGSKITPNELVVYGRENLATYKAPKIVYIAENFPKTKNGKILRRQIDASISLAKSDIRL